MNVVMAVDETTAVGLDAGANVAMLVFDGPAGKVELCGSVDALFELRAKVDKAFQLADLGLVLQGHKRADEVREGDLVRCNDMQWRRVTTVRTMSGRTYLSFRTPGGDLDNWITDASFMLPVSSDLKPCADCGRPTPDEDGLCSSCRELRERDDEQDALAWARESS